MRGLLVRGRSVRGVAMGLALAVGLVGAAGVAPATADPDPGDARLLSQPGTAVSLAQSGELALWGGNEYGQSVVPASLDGVAFSQAVLPTGAVLALTADGRVVSWGSNPTRLERVPAEVAAAKVAQIAALRNYAGAVTRDGRVLMWGKKSALATPLDVPAGLSGVRQLAISEIAAIGLKTDGSVVAWGRDAYGMRDVPEGLRATAIAASGSQFYALTEDGTVVRWGDVGSSELAAAVQQPGNVKAIVGAGSSALALLADNTMVRLTRGDGRAVPAELDGVAPVLLGSGGSNDFAMVDRDRAIHRWDLAGGVSSDPPSALNGRDTTQVVLADNESLGGLAPGGGVIVAKLLRAELPQVSGVARVGSVLSGVAGTFSDAPDSVSSQWLVDGIPVSNATNLAVTAGMVGKTIAYRSTAQKVGQSTVSSSSAGVKVPPVVVPPAPAVASTTKVLKATVAKKAAKVVLTAKVKAAKPATGKAVVTIKKGKKTIVAKTVGVTAAGAIKLSVAKFAKLVVKKTKAKGKKAKTAHRGKYTVTIRYLGNKQVKPSTGTAKFTVKK